MNQALNRRNALKTRNIEGLLKDSFLDALCIRA
jgi:hypothetical protein